MTAPFIHQSAEVAPDAVVGPDSRIWNWTKIREGASVGRGCSIGQGVYIDRDVTVGDECKIQNDVSIFRGVHVGSRVFVGPGATFTNDRIPRASSGDDWLVIETFVEDDVSIGANATIVCGVRLGKACMVGAGAVVTRDVPPNALVVGNPARVAGQVDLAGRRVDVAVEGEARS